MATSTTTSTPTPMSAIQHRVLDLLATGRTIAAAARECEIDRTTIYHWRRTSPDFAFAADDAALDAREAHRTAAQTHAEAAFKALRQILDDEDAPASVRCKAALYILNAAKGDLTAPVQVTAPALPVRRPPIAVEPPPAPASVRPAGAANSTQFNTFRDVSAAVQSTPAAQPQVGRNSPCPCQSGRKYKQCCLNNNSSSSKVRHATVSA